MKPTLESTCKSLLREVKRLARAETPRAQKNSRQRLYGLLRQASNIIKGDGGRRPCVLCPLCFVPISGWSRLARHLLKKHGYEHYHSVGLPGMTAMCPCGFRVAATNKGMAHFGSHLRGQKNLKAHLTLNRVGSNGVEA